MSDTHSGPPPLIGAGATQDKDKEKTVADDNQSAEDQKAKDDTAAEAAAEQQAQVDEVLNSQPDQRTEPYGESTLGFSVTNVDDEDKDEDDEPKTAFNSPKEASETPTGSTPNWGSELHVVNDPFEGEAGSPFDKGGFVGVDPYRAVILDVRNPGDESAKADDDDES